MPDHEAPHAAHSNGRRWLDLTLALPAMFVSIVSLAVAVHHGNAMEQHGPAGQSAHHTQC
jgi:hypothetical protein